MPVGLRVVEVYAGEVGHDAPLIARELIRLGVRVVVVGPPGAADAFTGTGAEVIPLAVGPGLGSLAALRRILPGGVIHAHGLRAATAVLLARNGGTPVVVSLTQAPPAGRPGALVTRAVIRAAAAVLAPTPGLMEAAVGLGAREVGLVAPPRPEPPIVERTAEQVREELALPPDGPIVLATARLHPDTRLDVLVEAATRWRRRLREPQVVLVGVGPAYRSLVAQATVARAPVTFAGDRTFGPDRTPPDQGAAAVARTDSDSVAAVSASASDSAEGAPPVLNPARGEQRRAEVPRLPRGQGPDPDGSEERASLSDLLAATAVAVVTDPHARPWFALAAAQAGVPVVAPQGGVVAELLGDAAVLVPTGDVDALDAAVRGLLDDGEPRLAAAARERLAGWPDAAAVAGQLAAWYERVSPATAAEAVDTPG